MLIDDQYAKLLEAFVLLDHESKEALLNNFRLVAFGATSLPDQCYGLQVDVLPSWDQLTERIVHAGNFQTYNAS